MRVSEGISKLIVNTQIIQKRTPGRIEAESRAVAYLCKRQVTQEAGVA